jgi:hypothetical protein
MKNLNLYKKSIACPSCKNKIYFSFAGGMNPPSIYVYSTDGRYIIVSEYLYQQIQSLLTFSKNEINTFIKQHFNKNKDEFKIESNVICGHCGYLFEEIYPDNLIARLKDNRPIFLEGMILITDKECFQIKLIEKS